MPATAEIVCLGCDSRIIVFPSTLYGLVPADADDAFLAELARTETPEAQRSLFVARRSRSIARQAHANTAGQYGRLVRRLSSSMHAGVSRFIVPASHCACSTFAMDGTSRSAFNVRSTPRGRSSRAVGSHTGTRLDTATPRFAPVSYRSPDCRRCSGRRECR
jgi:hypothetical protein